ELLDAAADPRGRGAFRAADRGRDLVVRAPLVEVEDERELDDERELREVLLDLRRGEAALALALAPGRDRRAARALVFVRAAPLPGAGAHLDGVLDDRPEPRTERAARVEAARAPHERD